MMHLVKGEPPKVKGRESSKAGGRPPRGTPAKSGYFDLNRAYLRRQAKEAIRLFFAPSAGVYTAVTGQNPRITREEKRKV